MILKILKINTNLGSPTNCYIITDENTKETMIIDPAGEVEKITEMLDILHAKVKYIYLTHCHGDHIGGVEELKAKVGGKILTHRIESENIKNPAITLNYYIGMKDSMIEIDSRVDEDDLIHIGNIEFKVIHTPGHTSGGSSLYCEEHKMVFTGDTLFRGTWGRTDLPTGDVKQIMDSIMKKLLILPEDTIVYPGHGKATLIKEEKPIYFELKPRGLYFD